MKPLFNCRGMSNADKPFTHRVHRYAHPTHVMFWLDVWPLVVGGMPEEGDERVRPHGPSEYAPIDFWDLNLLIIKKGYQSLKLFNHRTLFLAALMIDESIFSLSEFIISVVQCPRPRCTAPLRPTRSPPMNFGYFYSPYMYVRNTTSLRVVQRSHDGQPCESCGAMGAPLGQHHESTRTGIVTTHHFGPTDSGEGGGLVRN